MPRFAPRWGGERTATHASPLRKDGRRVLLFGHTRRESDSAACESLDITCLCPNSNTPAAKGWAVSRASFEARSLNARSRLRMTKLGLGGTSHGYQDGSGAGAAVRPRSPAARSVERDNRRHRFGIAHSVRVIASVARMSLCDIRGYATAVPGFRKRSSGLRRGIAHSRPAGCCGWRATHASPLRSSWPEPGLQAAAAWQAAAVHGYLRVGRLPSGCKRSVRAWRGTGGRANQQ